MFCTSLRKRPSFAGAIGTLKATPPSLRESQLNSHDLDLSFNQRADQTTGHSPERRRLRILLLSKHEIQQLDQTLDRVQHFGALTGGRDIAIVFLLNAPRASSFVSARSLDSTASDTDTSVDGVYAYTKLQTEMMNQPQIPHIPILPLASIDGLPRLLEKHIAALNRITRKPPPTMTSFDLLKQCTVEPMTQQTAFVLSDVFPNLGDLAAACSSVTSAPNSRSPSARAAGLDMSTQSSNSDATGKLKMLRNLVGDVACGHIIDFWKEEWTVD